MNRLSLDAMKARIDALAQSAPAESAFECTSCRDRRTVATMIEGVTREARCPSCRPRAIVANVPAPFQNVTFTKVRTNPGNQRAVQMARDFVAMTASRDLFLHGPVGTGKTHLAVATANEFAGTLGLASLFVRWPMTLHRLQPGSLDDSDRRNLEKQLFTVPLLVVDDIGAERDEATDFTRRMAYLTYEARGDAGVRTIITSNLDLDELAKHQGDDRLTSRLAGRCDVARIEGVDQRVERRVERQLKIV